MPTSSVSPPPHTGFSVDEPTPPASATSAELGSGLLGFGSGFGIVFILLLALSFTRSPSSRHPPFTQFPFPSRSLVRDGQTSQDMPPLVAPHSTCPSLSPSPHSPHANSFVIGTAVINTHTHTHTQLYNRSCSNCESVTQVRACKTHRKCATTTRRPCPPSLPGCFCLRPKKEIYIY